MNPVHTLPPYSPRGILKTSSHLHLGLPSGSFPSGLSTKILYGLLNSFVRSTCLAHLILFDFIALKYFVKRTNYEAPHYAAFSIFFSAPCSQTYSIYVHKELTL